MSGKVKQSGAKANPASRLPIPGPGRPRGSQNKITKNIRNNFEEVFEKLGGVNGFYLWAKKTGNQGQFYQMYSKMLPSNIDLDASNELKTILERIFTDKRPQE